MRARRTQRQGLTAIFNGLRLVAAACLALATGWVAHPPPALAAPSAPNVATINVTTLADEYGTNLGSCSLREAIQSANSDANFGGCSGLGTYGDDYIILNVCCNFDLTQAGAGDNTNATGDLDITSNLEISYSSWPDGPAVIRQTTADRVLHVVSPTVIATLNNIALTNGTTSSGGAGISNNGRLTLLYVSIYSNTSSSAGGGGIFNGGNLTVTYSTIYTNTALNGGALSNAGAFTITESALLSNTSSAGGGAIFSNASLGRLVNTTISGNHGGTGGGIQVNAGTTTLYNVTIISNTAVSSGGGALQSGTGTLNFVNTIIAGNPAPIGSPDCAGTLTSLDYNLVQTTTGCTLAGTLTHVISGTSPLLDPLAINGGITLNRRPATGSPAIDNGNPAGCAGPTGADLFFDQRGYVGPRPSDGNGDGSNHCDLGAVEYSPGRLQRLDTDIAVDEDEGPVTVRFERQLGLDGAVSATVTRVNGTAQAGSDFDGTPGVISWADLEGYEKTTQVGIVDDATPEPNEVFTVTLTNATGGAFINTDQVSVTVTIADEESPGELALGVYEMVVAEDMGAATVTVARVGGWSGAVSVDYAAAGGTSFRAGVESASAGSDFTAVTGTLSWADGDVTPRTFAVPLVDNDTPEPIEVIQLTLSNATGGADASNNGEALLYVLDEDTNGTDINVSTTADDATVNGNCTLREAIRAANLDQPVDTCPAGNGVDIIHLGALTYDLGLPGNDEDDNLNGDLDITETVTLVGSGAGSTVINANFVDRLLHVDPTFQGGVQMVVAGVTLRDGDPSLSEGGAIKNSGGLILRDSVLTENATGYNGGGLGNTGLAVVQNTDFTHNNASSYGGGVYVGSGAVTLLQDSYVFSNTAFYGGGGVFAYSYLVLRDNLLEENRTNDSTNSGGGGLAVGSQSAVVDNTIIRNNHSAYDGGGVNVPSSSWLVLSGGEIYSNTANFLGGGLQLNLGDASVLAGVRIASNRANDGGGVYLQQDALIVANSQVVGNTAFGDGGGLAVRPEFPYDDIRLSLLNTAVEGNTADESGGGVDARNSRLFGIASAVTGNQAETGGGLSMREGVKAQLLNTTVGSNEATLSGGAVLVNSSQMSLTHVTLHNNTAPLGPGLYLQTLTSTVQLRNTLFGVNGSANCQGPVQSLGHNLSGDNTCALAGTGDLNNVNPLLEALSGSGAARAYAPQSGSPAIDAADGAACPATDQRGLPRPVDGDGDEIAACDIGSIEFGLSLLFLPLVLR